MTELYSWLKNNIDWFAVALGAALLSLDWFDAFARYVWYAHVRRKSPIGQLVHSGRSSKEPLRHLTFKLFTTSFDPGPIEGWGNERPRSWFILVRETLPSRLRRRFTLAKAPTELNFVEVAYRRISPPQQGHIASFAADEWHTLLLRRTGFYRVIINTTRESLSPGTRLQLECGATVVKMGVRYVNDDNTPDGQITLGS